MQVGDSFISLNSEIRQHVVNYYKKLFAKDEQLSNDYTILRNFNWTMISESQNNLLTATPSIEEIRNVCLVLMPLAHLVRMVSVDISTISAGI